MRLLTPELILETIVSQHYDIKACDCWICLEAAAVGIRPTEDGIRRKRPHVSVKGS